MWTFLTVLRWIVAIPALLVGLLLQFLAIMLNLATGIIEILAGKAASLLATGTTLLLLLMLIIGENTDLGRSAASLGVSQTLDSYRINRNSRRYFCTPAAVIILYCHRIIQMRSGAVAVLIM